MASCPPLPQQQQGYPTTSGMMPQTTAAPIYRQPIAPVFSAFQSLPAASRMNSPHEPSPMLKPTPVVGSHGRRGVLPSAPGRPPAPAAGTGVTKTQIPQKDADGRFPCPYCTKTYLHDKYLKRHLLRHTGDRPYKCSICYDTFSRSDILTRHFTICSIRRGNLLHIPAGIFESGTGAGDLSYPQSHVKNVAAQQQAQQQQQKVNGDRNHLNGMGNMPPVSADGMNNFTSVRTQTKARAPCKWENYNQTFAKRSAMERHISSQPTTAQAKTERSTDNVTQIQTSPAVTTTQTTTERTTSTNTVNTPNNDQAQYRQQQHGLQPESTSTSGIQPPLPAATETTATDIVATYQPETDTAGNDVPLGYYPALHREFSWSEPFDSASPDTASNPQSAPDTPHWKSYSGSECPYDSAFPSKMASDLQSAPDNARLESAYPLGPLVNYHRYEED